MHCTAYIMLLDSENLRVAAVSEVPVTDLMGMPAAPLCYRASAWPTTSATPRIPSWRRVLEGYEDAEC